MDKKIVKTSQNVIIKYMSNVEFNEEKYISRSYDNKRSMLINLVMKIGAKNENQANLTLLVIGALMILLSIFIFIGNSSSNTNDVPPPPPIYEI